MTLKKAVDMATNTGALLSLIGMIGAVVIQVFARVFIDRAPAWTEELARIFFIYLVAFGGGLAIRDHAYIGLDYFVAKFNQKTINAILMIVKLIVLLFGLSLLFFSLPFVDIGMTETSPSLGFNMSYLFSSMLVLGGLIVFYSAYDLLINKKSHT